MRVGVLLFASLKEELGPRVEVDVPPGADGVVRVAALRGALAAAHPAFARLGRRALVAVGESYAADSDAIGERDEVAILPPVAGG